MKKSTATQIIKIMFAKYGSDSLKLLGSINCGRLGSEVFGVIDPFLSYPLVQEAAYSMKGDTDPEADWAGMVREGKEQNETLQCQLKAAEAEIVRLRMGSLITGDLVVGLRLMDGDGIDKDADLAVRHFKSASDRGDAAALFAYGFCLRSPIGTTSNYSEGDRLICRASSHLRAAADFFKILADKGSATAQHLFARCFLNGNGVAKDFSIALEYYKQSADQGNAAGLNGLGLCYQNGYGVAKDLSTAARYFKDAAVLGDPWGQQNFALCLSKGEGVGKDPRMAAHFFKQSADQGNAWAQNSFGCLLRDGNGVSKDLKESSRYFKLASDQGYS
jgi:TPR repeat protein